MEYNIDELVNNLDFISAKLVNCGNNLYLTNKEIEILQKYKVPYQTCTSLKELLQRIEEIFQEEDYIEEDLDYVSTTIAERDYYQNTNK